jgi:hypothetical protein
MTPKDRSIDRTAWRMASRNVIAATVLASATASAQTSISKVSLTLVTGDKKEPTAGALYKVANNARSHVAEVSTNGNVSKPIICTVGDIFEAEAESSLNRPLAPTHRTCDATMAFNFKRAVLVVSWGDTGVSPFDAPNTGAAVFSNYSTIFARMGQTEAASATSDAAIAAAGRDGLGDTKLEKYVVRDPSQGHRLVFSKEGVAALKEKQASFGIKPTGQLDAATQAAFATMNSKGVAAQPPSTVEGLRCVAKVGALGNPVVCAPSESFTTHIPKVNSALTGAGKNATVANMPAMAF